MCNKNPAARARLKVRSGSGLSRVPGLQAARLPWDTDLLLFDQAEQRSEIISYA
jgi:hypothetical protein